MSYSFKFEPIALPPEAQALRAEVRQFLREEIDRGTFTPGAERKSSYSPEFSRRVGARGWIGMTWPKAHGGGGRSHLERYVMIEEMLAHRAPVSGHWVADRQSGPVILKFGTEEAKRKVIPKILSGEAYFCIGLSEPNSGSDVFAASTRATKTDGGWLINGRKIWTSGAHNANWMIGLFRTSPSTSENRRHGLSQFLVDMTTPGIKVQPIRNITGHADFNEVVFDDVFVPDSHLIGEKDMAWKQATDELAYERSGPDRILETLPVLTELVRAVGAAPSDRVAEGIGREIAHLKTLRRMSVSVAGMLQAGQAPAVEAAVVKDLGTNWEQALPGKARLLLAPSDAATSANASGYAETMAFNTLIAPKLTIQGGTREVLRGIIARGLGLR